MKTIIVSLPVQDRHKAKLEAAGAGCKFIYASAEQLTKDIVAEAEIVIGNIPTELIDASPRLELLQLNSAGTDAYIKPGVLAPNTILTNATGAYSKAVSEHALAQLLMLQKKLHLYRDDQMNSQWADEGTVTSISDATVLIVGLGDIGLSFGKLVSALGAYTIGVKRRSGACPEPIDELYTIDALDKLLPRADVVASFLPGTGDTVHMYTAERFAMMKNSAIFINCGRGNAVSSEVLYNALSSGEIASAAVDVTEIEPLPIDSPLWSLKNLLITPHISGNYHLPETFERIIDIACENISAYLSGSKLRNVVDFKTGYKI